MSRITLVLLLFIGIAAQAQNSFFTESSSSALALREERPKQEQLYTLDKVNLNVFLDNVSSRTNEEGYVFSLPDGLGHEKQYRITESSVMEDDFQTSYPDIKTFKGQGITHPQETIRFSFTSLGFNAIILSTSKGTQFIKPIDLEKNIYSSFFQKDLNSNAFAFECQLIEEVNLQGEVDTEQYQTFNADDGVLREFRTAISATSEYSAFYNNDLLDVISAISVAVNNANAVLERDLSVRLTMIDNSSLIFFDPDTDPFTNFDNIALLGENQTLIDTVVGDANYDLGHVFNTAGGGVAGLNTSCVSGLKAWGVTGATSASDGRFLFVFLHELGHQFGSPHTFNSSQSPCVENISVFTALEPGSGSTIMAYPGLCGVENVINSVAGDLYYHQISLASMFGHLQSSGSCPINQISTGNTAPTANAGSDYLIPQGTPYKLTGGSTDPDGTSSHTYTWEQYDFGPQGAPTETTANGPLVRSFEGTTNPTRFIPNLPDLLTTPGSQTWERLVIVDRDIDFRLTVRDNDASGGQTAVDAMTATVTTQAGPFEVTSQNSPNQIVWTPGATETISWNVAGTTGNGINEVNVNILLSTDEGLTYDTVLVANTPNDGTENILVPNIDAAKCRIMVEAVDNIFFNINDSFFAIGNYTYGEVCEEFTFNINENIEDDSTSSFNLSINNSLEILDLNAEVNISNGEDNSDIAFALRSPTTNFAALKDPNCSGTSGLSLIFDDEGSTLDCNNLNSSDNVIPVNALSIFDNENSQGNWTFFIADTNENGITSNLDSVTLDICTIEPVPSLSIDDNIFEEFSIYPNPTSGSFNLNLNTSSAADILVELFDITGRRVKQNKYSGQASVIQNIDVNDLSRGVYIVKVAQGNRSVSKKLIVK